MINFIKNMLKPKKSLTQKNAEKAKIAIKKMKSKKPLYPTHFYTTTPLTQEQYEFLKKTLNARPDYRASIEGKIASERDSYAINKIL
jgi:hypothetical protein